MNTTKFVTDTATFCVFDVAAVKHRFDDDGDWWSIVEEELGELNAGNVAFIGLGNDGEYEVVFRERIDEDAIRVRLNCPSGRVFVGCGEEVTADGLEPEAIRGGTFLSVAPGNYLLSVARSGKNSLAIALELSSEQAQNSFAQPIRI